MRQFKIGFTLFMGLLGGVLLAQTEADFAMWMQGIAQNNGKMGKAITAKDAATVTASAKVLEDNFKAVETFFTKRGTADAAKMAKDAHMAAAAVQAAVAKGDWDGAATSAKGVSGSCAGCHSVHRGGEKGAYTIK
jgi:hypothetical protein